MMTNYLNGLWQWPSPRSPLLVESILMGSFLLNWIHTYGGILPPCSSFSWYYSKTQFVVPAYLCRLGMFFFLSVLSLWNYAPVGLLFEAFPVSIHFLIPLGCKIWRVCVTSFVCDLVSMVCFPQWDYNPGWLVVVVVEDRFLFQPQIRPVSLTWSEGRRQSRDVLPL